MEAERGIRAIDEILERLPAGLKDMAPQFHQWRDTLTMVKPWPPEVKQKELAVLNKILDCMQPFEGVVNAVARYCLKLQGAQLGIERVYDHAENIQFGREIRTELDLME
jgi:hypothetical protein